MSVKGGVHFNDIHGQIKPTDILIMCVHISESQKGNINFSSDG